MENNKKAPGQEFQELLQEARKDPEIANYLDSISVYIGNLVLHHRLERQLTQGQLAKLAHTTQSRISQIESGFGGCKLETIDKVCKALNIVMPNPIHREEAAASEAAASSKVRKMSLQQHKIQVAL
jgi:DNA-binding XRE family transcriptional regulator